MRKLLFISLLSFVMMSCSENEESSKVSLSEDLSLYEFAENVNTQEEREFLTNKENIIDLSGVFQSGRVEFETIEKPKVRFRWGGGNCSNPLGICLIIPLAVGEDPDADVLVSDNVVYLEALSESNGLTKDGYLPVFNDVLIDGALLKGSSSLRGKEMIIKRGIYKADFNELTQRYEGVAVELR